MGSPKKRIIWVFIITIILITLLVLWFAVFEYFLTPLLSNYWQTSLFWVATVVLVAIAVLAGLAEITGYKLKDFFSTTEQGTQPQTIVVAGLDTYQAPVVSPAGKPLQRPPRAEHFIGRETELAQLLDDLQPGRVVTLCGPGGIGKTALAAEAVWILAPGDEPPDCFPDGIIFHNFYRQSEMALALEQIARTYGEELKPILREAAKRALAGRRALLVLDGAEQADDLREVLDIRDQCGVLVTSRSRKDALVERQDISPLPLTEAVNLLQAWGGDRVADETVGRQICELAGGLPLAVRLIGRYLTERDENAADYLSWLEKTPLRALDQGQRQQDSVPLLLERSLGQVSEKARQVLAVIGLLAMVPLSREVIAAGLAIPSGEVGRWLGELVNYGLLLRIGQWYEVSHALIHTYARRRLTAPAQAVQRLVAYYDALAREQSKLGLEGYSRLDAERGHLLVVLARCGEAEEWAAVKSLVQAVDDYLDIRGHSTERVTVLEIGMRAAQARDDRRAEGAFLGKLGQAYHSLGQMEQAIENYEQALAISREIGDRHNEGALLGGLGNAYRGLGQVKQAIENYEQALAISREIGDRHNEGTWLGSLGQAYRDLGQVEKAIEYYHQALAISRQIGDRRREGALLGKLGPAYLDLGQVEKAIENYEQALAISQEVGDRHNEGAFLGGLGQAYHSLGQVKQAIENYEQALAISQEIGDRHNEGVWLGSLGNAYGDLGQMEQAIEQFQQAVAISRQIGDRRNEGTWLGNLGAVYYAIGEVERAKQQLRQSLVIFEEIKSPNAYLIRRRLDELKK